MLDVALTPVGRALRRKAEKIPYAVVERLGMEPTDLVELHRALTGVIAATQQLPAESFPAPAG
jgi:hypothetical protein